MPCSLKRSREKAVSCPDETLERAIDFGEFSTVQVLVLGFEGLT